LLKYPVHINAVEGTHVVLGDGSWLFTRKGSMTVTRITADYEVGKNKLLVEDGARVLKGTPLFNKTGKPVLSDAAGTVTLQGAKVFIMGNEQKIDIPNGSQVTVAEGQQLEAHSTLAVFDPFSEPIISEFDGYIHFEDIIVGSTITEELDEETGVTEKRVSDLYMDAKQPRLLVTDEAGNELGSYFLPAGAYLLVDDNTPVKAGDTLAKMLKEASKTSDITGGLPRVEELFEARRHKSPTVLSQITGTVQFKGISKGKRTVVVQDEDGKNYDHLVPLTKRLLVRNGDTVKAGEPLCDGAPDPHDILAILGEQALQNYLMDEIQQVYRMQGVSINDKHIGIIVRQMLRKVEIMAVGDTRFIFSQQVDKATFQDENARVIEAGGQPAIARPMFQAITKAALNINSFISAASFQETTRVLTNAAIGGATDELRGLKENVIIGHLIPAGTGIRHYRNIKLYDANAVDLDDQMNEIIERRRLEKEAEEAAQQQALQDIAYDMDED
jgi:DNA-directed RNA polymerase subunit beta'